MKFFIEKDIKNNCLQYISTKMTTEKRSGCANSKQNNSAESLIFCSFELLRKVSGGRLNTKLFNLKNKYLC